MSIQNNRLTMVRIDKKQQRRVSPVTLRKLMDRLKANVDNSEIAALRHKVKSLTTFGRYLSNVPDIQKVHVRSGTAYYVKYRKKER